MDTSSIAPATSGGDVEESALLTAARAGDREAFGALIRLHQDRVYRFIRKHLDDLHQAQEITQDTFLQAYTGLAGFRAEARFTTWLIGIALNLVRQHLRGKPPRGVDFSDEDNLTPDESVTSNPALAAERNALLSALQHAIDGLPAELREPFVMIALESLAYDEVAEMLQLPQGTVKSRVNRAREHLKIEMQAHDLSVFGRNAPSN